MQFCEPIAAVVIFPFVYRLVNETGVTQGREDRTGYYAGIIVRSFLLDFAPVPSDQAAKESAFFLGQALFTLQWGRLSDRIGRKPVLLIGIFGLALSILCFGLSRSFPGLVISRSLAGLLNGNVGVLKAMMGEITDDTNAAQGFAFIPMVWSTGSCIAYVHAPKLRHRRSKFCLCLRPLIGGMLSHPADSWEWFDRSFWKEFPYFLPCASAATVCLVVFLVGLLYLREVSCRFWIRPGEAPEAVIFQTAPARECLKSSLQPSEITPLLDGHQPRSRSPSPRPATVAPPLKAIITAPVIAAVLNYSLLALCEISFLAILPIFLASAPLSLTPRTIGILMGGMGIFDGTFQVLFTGALVERLGAKRMYQVSICAYFPLWALFPIAVSMTSADSYSWRVYFLACIGVMLATVTSICFSKHSNLQMSSPIVYSLLKLFVAVIFLFVRSAAPTPAALGTTNGLSQTMASFMRTIGPACATSLYAVSREHHLLGGQLVYIVLSLVTAVTFSASFLLPMTPCAHDT